MTDLTPTFNELLKQREAPAANARFNLDKVDGFLKEAFRINSHITKLHHELKDVRQAYLSTAQPRKTHVRPSQSQQRYLTDKEREEIDYNAKQMLRELNSGIAILEDGEVKRREDEERMIRKKYGSGLGALGSWAAGGKKTDEHQDAEEKAKGVGIHREGVIWFLQKQLQLCGATQHEMMEARLRREMEKSRSVLANAPAPLPTLSGTHERGASAQVKSPAVRTGEKQNPHGEPELTDQQRQMFEKGNQDMMSHYQKTLEQVKTAEQSLIEISEMQAAIGNHLDVQAAHIDQLVSDSFNTVENVGGGNKELKKAVEKPSTARYTFFAASGLCVFLILWDLII